MKNLEYYMNLKYQIQINPIEEDDGEEYFQLVIPDLPGFKIYEDSIQELMENVEDAKAAWFISRINEKKEIPMPNTIKNNYSGRITLRIAKSLHRELSIGAMQDGISLNSYISNLLLLNNNQNAMQDKFDAIRKSIERLESLKKTYYVTYNISNAQENTRIKSVDALSSFSLKSFEGVQI